jgi:hypothetical protein
VQENYAESHFKLIKVKTGKFPAGWPVHGEIAEHVGGYSSKLLQEKSKQCMLDDLQADIHA